MGENYVFEGFVSRLLDPKNMKYVGEPSYEIIELKRDQFPKTVPLKDKKGHIIGTAHLSLDDEGNVVVLCEVTPGFFEEAEDGSGTEASPGSGDRQDS